MHVWRNLGAGIEARLRRIGGGASAVGNAAEGERAYEHQNISASRRNALKKIIYKNGKSLYTMKHIGGTSKSETGAQ